MVFDRSREIALEDAAQAIVQREFTDSQGQPYRISPYHRDLFGDIAERIQQQGGNRYDVSIGFMLFIASSLVNPDAAAQRWAEITFTKCELLMPFGTLGQTVLD